MFNKLIKGFVISIALIGSLSLVGCDSTESVLEEDDRVEIENKYYNDNPSNLNNNENSDVVDEDDMKGFVEESYETITDENENKDYDPYTKALLEEELNKEYLDCGECGGKSSICEKVYGTSVYNTCGYCYAIYKEGKFTGNYGCNGCSEIVDHKVKPIDGEGTSLVCDDCYNHYHNPKTNDNLDENGNFINSFK